MKCRIKKQNSHITPQEFQEAMQGIAAYRQLQKEKAKLRTMLNCLSDADIRACLQEYEARHTVGGKPASEDTYQVLQAEIIRRGPYKALLNPRDRINKMLL